MNPADKLKMDQFAAAVTNMVPEGPNYEYLHDPRGYIESVLGSEEGSLPFIANRIHEDLGLRLERFGDKVRWVTKWYEEEK